MDPFAVGPASHVLAGRDDRAAAAAGHACGMRLVVVTPGTGLILVIHGVFRPRAAQVLQQALLDLAASEIRRGRHVCLLQPRRRDHALIQCATAASLQDPRPGREPLGIAGETRYRLGPLPLPRSGQSGPGCHSGPGWSDLNTC
jgi:hypothetical protein